MRSELLRRRTAAKQGVADHGAVAVEATRAQQQRDASASLRRSTAVMQQHPRSRPAKRLATFGHSAPAQLHVWAEEAAGGPDCRGTDRRLFICDDMGAFPLPAPEVWPLLAIVATTGPMAPCKGPAQGSRADKCRSRRRPPSEPEAPRLSAQSRSAKHVI